MEILGWAFAAILALTVLAGVVMGLVSLPDVLRYFKMRRM
jgi:hypothetical protein